MGGMEGGVKRVRRADFKSSQLSRVIIAASPVKRLLANGMIVSLFAFFALMKISILVIHSITGVDPS
jgi:hypothetical protein